MRERVKYMVKVGGSRAEKSYKTEDGARRWAASWAARVQSKNSKSDGSYEIVKLTVSVGPEYKVLNREKIAEYGNNNQG